jgi:hypothetical protein
MNKKIENSLLEESAQRMTEIVQAALDKFPPAERARRLKAYLAKKPTKTVFFSAERPSKVNGSPRTQGYRVVARPR